MKKEEKSLERMCWIRREKENEKEREREAEERKERGNKKEIHGKDRMVGEGVEQENCGGRM